MGGFLWFLFLGTAIAMTEFDLKCPLQATTDTWILGHSDSGLHLFPGTHGILPLYSVDRVDHHLNFGFVFEKELPVTVSPRWVGGRPAFHEHVNLEEFGILQSDQLANSAAAAKFVSSAGRLEAEMWKKEHAWDWIVNHKLLNLVDNGLFTVVAGVTRSRTGLAGQQNGSLSIVALKEDERVDESDYSTRYQMLPTDIVVDPHTGGVEIKSYINNLHPERHQQLYKDIESILGAVVPLFEQSLGAVGAKSTRLAGRTLQIVVGMKSVHLHSGKYSKFGGSQWHTEGLRNEDIIATAIFYYDVENITETQLEFKLELNHKFLSAENGNISWGLDWTPRGGGADGQDEVNESNYLPLGKLTCKTGRLVVFPNMYHHRVRPYQLDTEAGADEGHRKILVFFLLDPNRRIHSTSSVPPQQREWYTEEELGKLKARVGSGETGEWPYSIERALEYREGFYGERAASRSCKTHGKRD